MRQLLFASFHPLEPEPWHGLTATEAKTF
ncbi:hypothetical protein RSK20926_03674 [Roseobacter sp. SK209-2-6]|nr:hypothetical protein RSK20926_03674 [Roseobacter sp. SK209-2-6]